MSVAHAEIEIHTYLAETDERALADDVLDGLTRPFKELPPKHFYDTEGSLLFDRICALPEYYPTRTERAILTPEKIWRRSGRSQLRKCGVATRGWVAQEPPRRAR